MKKTIRIIAILLLVALSAALPIAVSARDNVPSLKIEAANLSFEDSVYPIFAVSGSGVSMDSVKLLVWTSAKSVDDDYKKGTEAAEISAYGEESVDGVSCKKFKYTKIYAQNMTDAIYVRAYAVVNGEAVYSELTKYSVIRYAYNKLGYTGTPTTETNLKTMLENMLVYGASAQQYFEYKTDRLATKRFYKVTAEGGFLPDGTSDGLYLPGESVTVKASSTDAAGNTFRAWVDETGVDVSTSLAYTFTLGSKNTKYTASYGEALPTPPEYTEPTIVVSSANAQAGDTGVEITIALKNNPGISSMKLLINYGEGLNLNAVSFNSAFGAYVTAPEPFDNPQSITFISPLIEVDVSGTFATLTFTVSDTATEATEIDVSVIVDQENTYDENFVDVEFATANGKIIIE